MIVKKFLQYWKSVGVILGILFLSLVPFSTFKGVPSFTLEDKIVHFLMYFGLTCILIFDYYRHKNRKSQTYLILICLVSPTLFGGIVEIIQGVFCDTRSAEWLDWLSDITGVVAGWYFMKLALRNGSFLGIKVKI